MNRRVIVGGLVLAVAYLPLGLAGGFAAVGAVLLLAHCVASGRFHV